MCHMSKHFEHPEVFDPTRFDPDKPRYLTLHYSCLHYFYCYSTYDNNMLKCMCRPDPSVYMNFGAGPRCCLGRHFAMVS